MGRLAAPTTGKLWSACRIGWHTQWSGRNHSAQYLPCVSRWKRTLGQLRFGPCLDLGFGWSRIADFLGLTAISSLHVRTKRIALFQTNRAPKQNHRLDTQWRTRIRWNPYRVAVFSRWAAFWCECRRNLTKRTFTRSAGCGCSPTKQPWWGLHLGRGIPTGLVGTRHQQARSPNAGKRIQNPFGIGETQNHRWCFGRAFGRTHQTRPSISIAKSPTQKPHLQTRGHGHWGVGIGRHHGRRIGLGEKNRSTKKPVFVFVQFWHQ